MWLSIEGLILDYIQVSPFPLRLRTQNSELRTQKIIYLTVEYHANAKYENPYQNSEKIACIGQRLMYPIMQKNNTSPC